MANTILCIEDNPHNMLLVRRILESFGYHLLQSSNGLEGIQIVETQQVDLVLLDINLPDIDGYEVIRRLRENENSALRGIPIIVISANALVGDDEKALVLGCNKYLTKPIDIQELRDAVQVYVPLPDESIE